MSHLRPVDETYEAERREHARSGRRPMSVANWVGLVLLLAAIAFYLGFAIPEFFGIVGQIP